MSQLRAMIAGQATQLRAFALAMLVCASAIRADGVNAQDHRGRPRITISKEITHILGPLRTDGYPDYLAALNQQCSKGVTVENNAAVPFWRAVGPSGIDKNHRAGVFKLLQMEQLPSEGEYLETFEKFAARFKGWNDEDGNAEDQKWPRRYQQVDEARRRPWSEDEFPAVAAWLKSNEKPLELVIRATRRPRFHTPLVAGDGRSMMDADLCAPLIGSREATRLLIVRAMSRLRMGETDGASRDLMACHRLARLVAQGPFLVDAIGGSAIEGMTCRADAVFAHGAGASDQKTQKHQEELQRLPALLNMAHQCDFGERLFFLSVLSGLPEGNSKDANAWLTELEQSERERMEKLIRDPAVDWDRVHRTVNVWFDKLAEAWRQPSCAKRKAAMEDLASKSRALRQSPNGQPARVLSATEQIGDILVAQVIPDSVTVGSMDVRMAILSDLRDTAFVLASYRRAHGSYPTALKDLIPAYAGRVPRDPFAEQDVRYRRQGTGYVLYSVGRNGKDDGGRDQEDAMEEWSRGDGTEFKKIPNYDDIVVRTPEEDR